MPYNLRKQTTLRPNKPFVYFSKSPKPLIMAWNLQKQIMWKYKKLKYYNLYCLFFKYLKSNIVKMKKTMYHYKAKIKNCNRF